MRPQPAQRLRVIRTESKNVAGDRHERVKVEAARPAVPDPGDSERVPAGDGVAQLGRDHPRPLQAQRARLSVGCRQPRKGILFHPVEVEMPGDDPGASGRRAKAGQRRSRAVLLGYFKWPISSWVTAT